ncbi:hypothetical protein GW891_03895 [bacterium]|nr:hypothetical protein [bacterium]
MADFLILDDDKKSESDNIVTNTDIDQKTDTFMDKLNNLVMSLQKVKTSEKVIFYRLLSTMTNA